MNKSRLTYLIERYSQNTASAAERKELSDFIAKSRNDELFSEVIMDFSERYPLEHSELQPYEDLADQALLLSRPAEIPEPYRIRRWVWAAACMLLLVSAGVYFRYNRPAAPQLAKKISSPKPNIAPGKNGAILTLADGSTVSLDSLGRSGKIASQNGADIVIRQGKVAYSLTGNSSSEVAYNTLSTPKGRQFHIQLPDGTEVWLNAASSIHYPTVFNGKDRSVEVTGEAYFEVANNPSMPFRVNVDQQAQIQVLGTHFNVNAYSNEPVIKTTLLEGSIQFRAGGSNPKAGTGNYPPSGTGSDLPSGAGSDPQPGKQMVTLRPGQQSQLEIGTRRLAVENDVETDKAIAWKNGLFNFNDAGLQEVMNQLERWYDIQVIYKSGIPPIRFFGKMTKNISLSDLLLILEKSKVHFEVEGRRLVVLK